jgi:hypothetical protein
MTKKTTRAPAKKPRIRWLPVGRGSPFSDDPLRLSGTVSAECSELKLDSPAGE